LLDFKFWIHAKDLLKISVVLLLSERLNQAGTARTWYIGIRMPGTVTKLERAYPYSNLSAFIVALVSVVCYAGIGWHHQYVFTPESMKEIAVRAIADAKRTSQVHAMNKTSLVENVVDGLRAQYGDYIFESPTWMFNNAGGAMGAMLVGLTSAQDDLRLRYRFSTRICLIWTNS
jgi:ERG2 and Sigma1 receptor like protein